MITPENPAVLVRDFKTEKNFIITRSDIIRVLTYMTLSLSTRVIGWKRAADANLASGAALPAGGSRIAGAEIASADTSPEMRFPAPSSGSRSTPLFGRTHRK